jgi:RNA polymerase sigma-70 factor (ECF subfamily)
MQTTGISGMFSSNIAETPHPRTDTLCKVAPVTVNEAPSSKAIDSEVSTLVEQARSGDSAALESLFQRMRPRAMAIALKVLHNQDDAQDAVQDAFIKVWKSLDNFEGRASFSTWLHRIVMNASLDILRRTSSRPDCRDRHEDGEEASPAIELSHDLTPERVCGDREVASLVRGAVYALPLVHRQAMEMREFDELAYEEMAKEIHCPIGTVMSRLHNARRRLADALRGPLSDVFELYAA